MCVLFCFKWLHVVAKPWPGFLPFCHYFISEHLSISLLYCRCHHLQRLVSSSEILPYWSKMTLKWDFMLAFEKCVCVCKFVCVCKRDRESVCVCVHVRVNCILHRSNIQLYYYDKGLVTWICVVDFTTEDFIRQNFMKSEVNSDSQLMIHMYHFIITLERQDSNAVEWTQKAEVG